MQAQPALLRVVQAPPAESRVAALKDMAGNAALLTVDR
jgi:hypothetical protein